MPQLPQDELITYLKELVKQFYYFPQSAKILELAIEQIEQVKEAEIKARLQRLEDEDEDW
ncbi:MULTISPECIES: hypothetical protein [unclassified Moorena]|uniref:hypothetical protein n=1 Tax=unclassified Moorena TaxID=2683338 RepID=UPI0013BABB5C|nr:MULTISPECIES: hypothetical protein [unclassified Moorena]NEP37311.1 hypothetical protein [Moorena sp. SIO3B2]NER87091.1 hypothetical protein [Moorena sp. SIO3A2]